MKLAGKQCVGVGMEWSISQDGVGAPAGFRGAEEGASPSIQSVLACWHERCCASRTSLKTIYYLIVRPNVSLYMAGRLLLLICLCYLGLLTASSGGESVQVFVFFQISPLFFFFFYKKVTLFFSAETRGHPSKEASIWPKYPNGVDPFSFDVFLQVFNINNWLLTFSCELIEKRKVFSSYPCMFRRLIVVGFDCQLVNTICADPTGPRSSVG